MESLVLGLANGWVQWWLTKAKLFISSWETGSIPRLHIFNWAQGYSPHLSSGCFHAGKSCLGPDQMVEPAYFLSSHQRHHSLISEELIWFASPAPFSFCWNWSHCSRSGSENPSTTSSDPPRLIQSLPSPVHNICSLGCHLTARCGYSVSFTVVSNQFVWFSQLDWKAFGSRPCLPWDLMTQWFVCGNYYILMTTKKDSPDCVLVPGCQDIAWTLLRLFFLKFLAS